MPEDLTTDDVEASFIYFAEATLGFSLYDWQSEAVEAFDELSERMVLISVATPNGSGKSSVLIPTIVFGALAMYRRPKVILTTADSKQLDGQVMPAINEHRGKFPHWKFTERHVENSTGGMFTAFTTDEPGRAEGWHKYDDTDGPLIIIVDEGKSVPDQIFQAINRCSYNALLVTSSPGKMSGYFYDSQFKREMGFHAISVGLKDCPHIGQDKIDRIIAQYGPNSPFTRSTLHGEFIEIFDGEAVYYAYSRETHEAKDLGWPKGATLVVGMDVGTHNASVIMAAKEDANKRMHLWVMREIILTGSDTDRQCIELLRVLAQEFPFWNSQSPVCPQTLFFCDPAARNSAYTSRGPNSSALKVINSHGIFPGYKVGLGLQPSIATVNRILQEHHFIDTIDFRTGEKTRKAVWHFQIHPEKCPVLADAMAARYRYPSKSDPGYGSDLPGKGDLVEHCDHVCFVGETPILTESGLVSLSSLKIGDSVVTRRGNQRICAAMARVARVCEYRFSDGRSVVCTPDHPFWTRAEHRMKPIGDWDKSDCALDMLGGTKTRLISRLPKGHKTVFSLSIECEHEYFANGMLVSNCDAFRYAVCNVLDIATEQYDASRTAAYDTKSAASIEPPRTI